MCLPFKSDRCLIPRVLQVYLMIPLAARGYFRTWAGHLRRGGRGHLTHLPDWATPPRSTRAIRETKSSYFSVVNVRMWCLSIFGNVVWSRDHKQCREFRMICISKQIVDRHYAYLHQHSFWLPTFPILWHAIHICLYICVYVHVHFLFYWEEKFRCTVVQWQ